MAGGLPGRRFLPMVATPLVERKKQMDKYINGRIKQRARW